MRAVAYIYVGFYALFAVWVIASDIKDGDPLWEVAIDALLLPLGFLGMLLFLADVSHPSAKSLWKLVSVVVIAGQVFTNVFSRHLTLEGKTELDPERVPQWAILASDLTVVIVLAPMFVMNALYAYP